MIRPFIHQDIPQINVLYLQLFEYIAEKEPDYLKASYQDENFLKTVVDQRDGFIGYVFEEEGKIKGFILAQVQTTPPYNCFKPLNLVYIMDILVDSNTRGLGIETKLIDKVKAWNLEQGVDYIELSVLTKNQKAYELYLREGFSPYMTSMRVKLK